MGCMIGTTVESYICLSQVIAVG